MQQIAIIAVVAMFGLVPMATSLPSRLGSIQGRDINLGPVDNITCLANGALPSDDCDKYYSCYNGNAHMMQCQQDWLFDLVYYGCNYPEMTDCGNRTRPDGYPTAPTAPSSVATSPIPFTCPATGGTYQYPGNCNLFIVCVNWIPQVNSCPSGLVFNPTTLQCDWPANVPNCIEN